MRRIGSPFFSISIEMTYSHCKQIFKGNRQSRDKLPRIEIEVCKGVFDE